MQTRKKIFGSDALPGKMLLIRIIVNDEIDAYFWPGLVKKRLTLSHKIRKEIKKVSLQGLEIGKYPSNLFSINLDKPAFYRECIGSKYSKVGKKILMNSYL